jgi:hypothetical protein
MKSIRFVQKLSVALATVGMLVPNVGVAVGAQTQPVSHQGSSAVRVVDVALVDGGTLNGQVVDGQGAPKANAPVTIHQGKDAIATVVTDKNGDFAVKNMKGGMYVVSTQNVSGVVRAWSPQTAPPSAVKGVLLVPNSQAVRGQIVDRFGVGAIVVGTIAATIIAVSIDHSSAS